ncbi:hypothetical protein [Okeania sp. SIO2G5]|uniref:hypothetical protein n=1 Tax=Okeania sp. SIO2G5 TaxID=2607796 RepID=UPI0013BF5901|nr:hypothetical protein [Okeania sp. SIO2G5]NEP76308.1 hypothetical protein [Okeania sp. SIO2G5]
MDDPRPQSAKAAHAVSLNRDAYSGESKLLLSDDGDDDGDDDDESDDDGPDQNIQSTVNRMRF